MGCGAVMSCSLWCRLSGSASSHPAEVPVTSHLARRTSRELDVLAFVAEAVRLGDEPSKTRHAKDLGVRREDRVKGKRSARKRPTGRDWDPI